MPPLTATDRRQFTAAQLVEIDKLSTAHLDELVTVAPSDLGMTDGQFKKSVLDKWKLKSPGQLRTRVNMASISWGSSGPIVTWSREADYTSAQQSSIQDILKNNGGKFEYVALRVVAGEESVEQRLAKLEGGRT